MTRLVFVEGMDECHGLLVTHEDGRVECLDVDCVELDAARHDWRAGCADVPGLCGCGSRERATDGQAARSDRQWAA
jgi:hypothetical protein